MNEELPFFTIILQASTFYNFTNYLELSFFKTILSTQIFCNTFAPGLSKYKDIQLFPLLNQPTATQNKTNNWTQQLAKGQKSPTTGEGR